MRTTCRPIRTLCLAAVAGASALGVPGCGDSGPPPLSKEEFDASKKQAEVIIQKEYGQKAFSKGQAAEKARSK